MKTCEHCKKEVPETQLSEVETVLYGTNGRAYDYHTAVLCEKCFDILEHLRVKIDTDFIRAKEAVMENSANIPLPCKVRDLKDTLISHNAIVAIWVPDKPHSERRIWRGMFWQLPDDYTELVVKRIMGITAITLYESGTINILTEGNEND